MSTQEAASALGKVPGGLVKPATAKSSSLKLSVGTNRTRDFGKRASGVKAALPDIEGLEGAKTLANGTVVYAGDHAAGGTVIPTANGVQVLMTVANASAQTSFRNELHLQRGQSLVTTSDGGAQVVDRAHNPVLVLGRPWARDAQGKTVPTRYVIEDNTVIQQVDHRALGVSYPVTADPTYFYWWGGNKTYTNQQASFTVVPSSLSALIPGVNVAGTITAAAIGYCSRNGKRNLGILDVGWTRLVHISVKE